MSQARTSRTPVLIVGGGPVGLALAVELGIRDIPCVVVEQNQPLGPLQAPRSKMINARAMAHMRRWGLATAIRSAIPLGPDYPSNVIFATRLTGSEIARFENAFSTQPCGDDRFPDGAAWLPQYRIEDTLRARARQLPSVTLLLGARLQSLTQTRDHVDSIVADARGDLHIESSYLVAADGARSTVRALCDIAMVELPSAQPSGTNINALIRVPGLAKLLTLGPAVIYQVVNAEVSAGMGPFDVDDRWFINAFPQNWQGTPDEFDLVGFAQMAIGARTPVEVICRSIWSPRALLAQRYVDRRVLLAGDACQVRPPTGGYGMNLGIGDAVDIGWKLAATLQGWGGPELLRTYELERKKVHLRVLREALENYSFVDSIRNARIRPDDLEVPGVTGEQARTRLGKLIRKQKEREYHTLGVVLGDRYTDSPIVAKESGVPPLEHYRDYTPSTYPGCLAPHLWLPGGTSLYDAFGLGFALIHRAAANDESIGRFVAAAKRQHVPLTIFGLPPDLRLDLYPCAFTLVRPDQHVAWRGDTAPENTDQLLRQVRGDATDAYIIQGDNSTYRPRSGV